MTPLLTVGSWNRTTDTNIRNICTAVGMEAYPPSTPNSGFDYRVVRYRHTPTPKVSTPNNANKPKPDFATPTFRPPGNGFQLSAAQLNPPPASNKDARTLQKKMHLQRRPTHLRARIGTQHPALSQNLGSGESSPHRGVRELMKTNEYDNNLKLD